jgi:hypothetical protein
MQEAECRWRRRAWLDRACARLELRRAGFWWLVSAWLGLATVAEVQAADVNLGGFGSYLDTEDLGESWGGGLRIKYDLIEYVGFDIRGSFARIQDYSISVFPVEGNLFLQLPIAKRILPYGGFGVGYYFFDGGDIDLGDELGYGPLAGLELRLGRGLAIFGEARWLFLEPDDRSSGGASSVKLDGFGINAGIMFLF